MNSTCVRPCTSGTFLDPLNSRNCMSCNSNCLTCATISTNCLSCRHSSIYPYLFQSSCLAACPPGFIPSSNNTCSATSSVQSSSQISASSILPLPLSIICSALILVTFFSKANFSKTLIPASLCAFTGAL
jgi:hypothetical protein